MENKNRSFINVDGVSLECWHLRYNDTSSKPTLVFLHEGLGCVELWRDFPENLCAATGLNGFVYSRQGYGASDPVALPRPLDFMHQEAINIVSPVLNEAKIKSAILIGHSDGGSISLIHAGVIQDPRVKSITTIAAHVFNEELTVKSIQEAKKFYETEASGNITLKNVRSVSRTGVDRISVGSITHSAPAIDFKLEI